jgi:hypothetical protein
LFVIAGKFLKLNFVHDFKTKNHNLKFKIQLIQTKSILNSLLNSISIATTIIMNLLDLGDDELILLFQYVDHKTKLNLMLTCKRFENVIGNYIELFGKFKLSVKKDHLKSPDRVQTLTQMRRHFAIVELNGHDLNLDTEVMQAYNLVFQLLTRIGSNLVELDLTGSQFCFVSLVNLLKLTPNIAKLVMFDVRMTPKSIPSNKIKLGKLKRLEIHNSSSIEIFEKLIKPNSLNEIKIMNANESLSGLNRDRFDGNYEKFTASDYRSIPRILSKQEKLVSLELIRISIIDFPESPNWNWDNLQELVLNRVEYPTPNVFKNLAGFLKKLKKLTDLSVAVWQRETDQLIELFSLPKLKKLKYEFEFYNNNQLRKIANWKFRNPGVVELSLEWTPAESGNKYSQFVKIFPNVRKAKIDFDDYLTPDMTPLNSWTSLQELELTYVHVNMLPQIKNLRSLKINKCCDASDSDWNCFCQKNRQLERLEFDSDIFIYKHFVFVAEHLPNLKVLITKTIWPKKLDPYRRNDNEPFIK